MKNIISFSIFVATIALLAALNIFSFWGIASILILVFVGAIITTILYPPARDYLGLVCCNIGHNNNYRLLSIGLFTLLCFILAFKYGAGEPLFLSAWRDTIQLTKPYYTEEKQQTKNLLLYGQNNSDLQMRMDKDYLQQFDNQYPLVDEDTLRQKKNYNFVQHRQNYNERISNWSRYGIFVDDLKVATLLKQRSNTWEQIWKQKQDQISIIVKIKTWVFWKLAFTFLLLFIFYLPFAFSDEMAEFLESIVGRIKRVKDEIKADITPTEPTTTSTPIAKISGLFGKLFASDMLVELAVRLLQGGIKLFRG